MTDPPPPRNPPRVTFYCACRKTVFRSEGLPILLPV